MSKMTHEQAVNLLDSTADVRFPDKVEDAVDNICDDRKLHTETDIEIVADFLEQWAAALRAEE